MVDERRPESTQPVAGVDLGPILRLVEGLRDDNREDNAALERRLMHTLREYRRDMTDFVAVHARDHEQQAAHSESEHATFREFIANAAIEQAYRNGALGVVRYVFELFSKHARSIAQVLLAAAALLMAASGNVHVGLGS